jgi:hypothetical protein
MSIPAFRVPAILVVDMAGILPETCHLFSVLVFLGQLETME